MHGEPSRISRSSEGTRIYCCGGLIVHSKTAPAKSYVIMASQLKNHMPHAVYLRQCFGYSMSCLLLLTVMLIGASYDSARVSVSRAPRFRTLRRNHAESVQSTAVLDEPQKSLGRRDDFMKQQALVQTRRKMALKEVCRRHPELLSQQPDSMLMFSEKSKLVYCSIPKTGCSNWKRVFMVLEGYGKNTSNISAIVAHFRNPVKHIFPVKFAEKRTQITHTSKFMFVRHPFVRLISAYRNKIEGDSPFGQFPPFLQIAKYIAMKYRKGAVQANYKRGTLNVTWEEWIRYLTDPSERHRFNNHWKEMYKLCAPCNIQYDFIGHLETVDEDSRFMFAALGINMSYPASKASTSSNDLYKQYFANVSRKDIQRLWEIYKLDFELFGFAKPDVLSFKRSDR